MAHIQAQIDRSLLNPLFDNYKLADSQPPVHVPLPSPLNLSVLHQTSTAATPFRILELFGRSNLLVPCPSAAASQAPAAADAAANVVYLDDTRCLVHAQLPPVSHASPDPAAVRFTRLHALPAGSPSPSPLQAASPARPPIVLPPSIVFVDIPTDGPTSRVVMLVSDGGIHSSYAVEAFSFCPATLQTTHLATIQVAHSPLAVCEGSMVLDAVESNGELLVCVLQAMPAIKGDNHSQQRTLPPVRFALSLVRVHLPVHVAGDSALPTKSVLGDVLLTLVGDSAPFFARIEAEDLALCISAPTPFEPLRSQSTRDHKQLDSNGNVQAKAIEPPAPTSAASATTTTEATAEPAASAEPAPPPYAWTQTGDEVTIVVSLPEPSAKQDIRVVFQHNTISAKCLRRDATYIAGTLFDSIHPADCLWTLEDGRRLTLYLEKTNSDMRWTHVFEHDDGVLESLEPGVLAEYLERLEKYQGGAGIRGTDGGDGSSMAVDQDTSLGGPGHMEFQTVTERQENVDFEGASMVLMRAALSHGDGAAGHAMVTHQSTMPGMSWLGGSLDRAARRVGGRLMVFMVQSDVDAIVFELHMGMRLQHTATVCALGFVQASKRDKKLVCLTDDKELAFVLESKQYLYAYERPLARESSAKQFVVDLAGHGHAAGPGGPSLVLGIAQTGHRRVCVLQQGSLALVDL
ncbi:hypothetical protein BC831DRAFT_547584 [Entophlyctis helioformis]|nr:hypothetical protein BC831DRAFT_547584 [Entophlyctis helioformis]